MHRGHPVPCLVLGWLLSSVLPGAASGLHDPPHILLIIADDLGWADVGYHAGQLHTPNLDKLAAEGVVLEQLYVQPSCTQTRAALLTGRHPIRQRLQRGAVQPWSEWGLPLEERTLAEALRDAGYATALVGKWHLGAHERAYLPLERGFDSHYGPYYGAVDHLTHRWLGALDWHRNGEPEWEDEGWDTELFADEAVSIVENHPSDQPLFLLVAFTAPHLPLQAQSSCFDHAQPPALPLRRVFSAMVTCMDEAVGRILAAFDQRDFLRDTIVLFLSDNGATSLGGGSNAPLRSGKGSLYEGGIRVPGIAAWPARLRGGRSYDHLLHATDFYPTLLSLADADLDQVLPIDGVDAWPGLRNGRPVRSELFHNAVPGFGALRSGPWKLVRTPDRDELYYLALDPGESLDLATRFPHVLRDLRSRLAFYEDQALPPRSFELAPPPGFEVPDVWGPPVTVVPEPGDPWLVGAALIALAGAGRRLTRCRRRGVSCPPAPRGRVRSGAPG